MCRFKKIGRNDANFTILFQYILCVGSRDILEDIAKRITKFQYILCVGSRREKYLKERINSSFNTSYVSVQDDYSQDDMYHK